MTPHEIIVTFIMPVFMLILTTIVTVLMRRSAAAVVERQKLLDKIDLIDRQLTILGVQVSPLWAAVQKKISGDLHHPDPRFKEMDVLLEKLEALTIDDSGRIRLKELLIERSHDTSVDDEQRASATIMIGVMEKVLIEAETKAPLSDVQLVGSKAKEK